MEHINIKIICEKPVHAEIIDYILKLGIMNLEEEFIKEVIGYEEWNGKLSGQFEIKELMGRMCEFCEIVKTEFGYGFGKDFEDDRPEGHIAFCVRKNTLGDIELHAEAVSHDDEGNEACEYDGNAKINFCPICGRDVRKEDEGK